MSTAVHLTVAIKRHHPRMPRFVAVIPHTKIAAWRGEGTTTVEGMLNEVPAQVEATRWARLVHRFAEPICRRAQVDTGDAVILRLRVPSRAHDPAQPPQDTRSDCDGGTRRRASPAPRSGIGISGFANRGGTFRRTCSRGYRGRGDILESVPCKGQSAQPVQVRFKEVSVHLGSYMGDGAGDQTVEASGTEARLGPVSRRLPLRTASRLRSRRARKLRQRRHTETSCSCRRRTGPQQTKATSREVARNYTDRSATQRTEHVRSHGLTPRPFPKRISNPIEAPRGTSAREKPVASPVNG